MTFYSVTRRFVLGAAVCAAWPTRAFTVPDNVPDAGKGTVDAFDLHSSLHDAAWGRGVLPAPLVNSVVIEPATLLRP